MMIFMNVLQLEKLISKNYFLDKSAKEAYKAYIRAYASHSLKSVYNVENLDLQKVAKSFGFTVPPFVDISILSLCIKVIKIKKHIILCHLKVTQTLCYICKMF